MTDRIADIWGQLTPHAKGTVWPARVDQHLEPGLIDSDVDRWVQSACLLCSNGCGCDIAVKDGKMVGIRGRATDVVNHGRLGPKGLYGSTPWASSADRLTRPMVRENGRLVETDWPTAMGRIVETSKRLLADKGPLTHGFYTTGQIFIEEYYTLGVIGKAGLGTPHMDGNTRLCTATSAAAFKESFGADGQPGSYTDIEHCDAIFLYGHNMAETQTVLWMRILDRTRGEDPPAIVCVDPRRTPVAEEAVRTGGVHLAAKVGTNMALMNGLTRELLVNGWVDVQWVQQHTIGMEDLRSTVEPYTAEKVADICGIDAEDLRRAARLFGESENVLSTVLQGFYQSHQATAASVAVHNLHLLRGMIGRPGAGILQMNGQPTAQNNRECGADGDLPGFRNWDNPSHVQELAELWNVDVTTIPHWAPPTNAMQIFGYAEDGTIGLLWISATNPAVSMPESARIRKILSGEQCFVIVQDLFLTESAQLADVVLPAAGSACGTTGSAARSRRFGSVIRMIRVRLAEAYDADELGAVHAAAWEAAYAPMFEPEFTAREVDIRRGRWHQRIAEQVGSTLLAELDGRTLALSYSLPSSTRSDLAEIYSFYGHPDGWGSGVAGALMTGTLHSLGDSGYTEVHLWTLKSTAQSRRFYSKCRFTETGAERTYDFGDGQLRDQLEFHRAV